MIRVRVLFFAENLVFQTSKLLMVGWISGKKGKKKYAATLTN